jgi:glutamate N-acetyltransferase/amino-acid N-acetyltransferase
MADSKILSVPGFRAGGKRGKKYGVALIVPEQKSVCSVMVTSNKIKAAPVQLSLDHAQKGKASAVVITSGNANAFTGERGKKDAQRICEIVSREFNLDVKEVLVNSTGIIGQPLDMGEIEDLIEDAAHDMKNDKIGFMMAAKSMMTTDSFQKISSRRFLLDGKTLTVTGIAKGAGMIAPDLMHATMIAVISTDAVIPGEKIDAVLREAVEKSFNMIVVDGDTSTNDMVLIANGKANNSFREPEIQKALDEVCLDLAKMIVRDGEGATKFFSARIKGARSLEEARIAARTVAGSTLVKTALFGENPNWGRVIAAVGYSGADFKIERLSLKMGNDKDEVVIVKNGSGVALKGSAEIERAGEILKEKEVTYTIDLGVGDFEATAFGCDLGYSYVKVNAEYTS